MQEMVKRKMTNVLVALVALATMLHTTQADKYFVGDQMGWIIPPNGAADYAAWADDHSPLYVEEDSIVFNFPLGTEDVAIVSKDDFDSCNTKNPIWQSSQPSWFTEHEEGTYYYIGTFAGHCEKGQKIALTWTNAPPSTSSIAPAHCPTPSSSQPNTNAKLPRKIVSLNKRSVN